MALKETFSLDFNSLFLKKPDVWLCNQYSRSFYNPPNAETDLTVWQNCISSRVHQTNSACSLPNVRMILAPGAMCREGVRLSNPLLHFPTFWQVCSFQFPNANWQRPLDLSLGLGSAACSATRGDRSRSLQSKWAGIKRILKGGAELDELGLWCSTGEGRWLLSDNSSFCPFTFFHVSYKLWILKGILCWEAGDGDGLKFLWKCKIRFCLMLDAFWTRAWSLEELGNILVTD